MTPEHEHAHLPHRTGHRWLDLSLALSAMFVSVVSLIVAVRHGAAMDRLVAANSWPFLMYGTSNRDPQGHLLITLKVVNAGVGPARIQTFEMWWQGQPVASADELLTRCCILEPTRSDLPPGKAVHMSIGYVAPSVVRGGDSEDFMTLERMADNADVWERLNVARVQLKLRACYCSVFDECWVTDLVQTHAQRVSSCPAAKVPFSIPETWFKVPPQPAATAN
jgi:hypothetical protein